MSGKPASETGGGAVRRYRDEMDSEYRPVFDRLHRLIVATCPDAEVVLSYGMPTYRIGRRRLNIGVWKHGLSLYVLGGEPGRRLLGGVIPGVAARPGLPGGDHRCSGPQTTAGIPDAGALRHLIWYARRCSPGTWPRACPGARERPHVERPLDNQAPTGSTAESCTRAGAT